MNYGHILEQVPSLLYNTLGGIMFSIVICDDQCMSSDHNETFIFVSVYWEMEGNLGKMKGQMLSVTKAEYN